MTLYKGTQPIAGLAKNIIKAGWNIFDNKWSDHTINDIQWLRADTFSWQAGDVYVTAYNKLVSEYATGTAKIEDGIAFRQSTNGFRIATPDQEALILDLYNDTGVAWYYILDTENERFKLPRTKYGFVGLRDEAGKFVPETLPNITGSISGNQGSDGTSGTGLGLFRYDGGSFKLEKIYKCCPASGTTGWAGTNYNSYGTAKFDASLSSPIYQDNAHVQQKSTQMYLYFYVGEFSQTAIEQTAGITTEQLNGKVDVASLVETHVVIETYVNGTEGYWIRSDGYCEQWGRTSATTSTNITFLKTMKDDLYNPQITVLNSNGDQNWAATSLSTTGFTLVDSESKEHAWSVSGYLADGEY